MQYVLPCPAGDSMNRVLTFPPAWPAPAAWRGRGARSAAWMLGTPLLAAAIAVAIADRPEQIRLVLAAVVAVNLLLIAVRWQRAAILVTLVLLLPFLALIRRLLIPMAGFTSLDPLLLVAPALAAFLVLRLFLVDGRTLAGDRLSMVVLALVVLTVLQIFNPDGSGVTVGAASLLFVGHPLLWFFIGRELVNRRLLLTLFAALIGIAGAVALYGLSQTEVGLPSWDAQWVQLNGYAALDVGGEVRAFGTFASAAEYAVCVAAAAAMASAFALHRHVWGLPLLPVLIVALVFAAVRSVIVLCVLAIVLAIALRSRRAVSGLAIFALGLVLVVVGIRAYGDRGASAASPFVQHAVGGLANPLDPSQSTLAVHWELLWQGVREGFEQPLGHGTGATTGAARLAGEIGPTSSELDFGNAFVELGLLGGLLFVAVVVGGLLATARLYVRTRDRTALAALVLLIVTLGNWVGGYYALAPLAWATLGWVVAETSRLRAEPG